MRRFLSENQVFLADVNDLLFLTQIFKLTAWFALQILKAFRSAVSRGIVY
jgi:hypothetical protein